MQNFETGNRQEAIKYKFTLKECLFGDAQFYRRVATVVVPMIIQNTLSNIVGLLDNVGGEVLIVNTLGENIIVKVKEARVAISDELARKIMV